MSHKIEIFALNVGRIATKIGLELANTRVKIGPQFPAISYMHNDMAYSVEIFAFNLGRITTKIQIELARKRHRP